MGRVARPAPQININKNLYLPEEIYYTLARIQSVKKLDIHNVLVFTSIHTAETDPALRRAKSLLYLSPIPIIFRSVIR